MPWPKAPDLLGGEHGDGLFSLPVADSPDGSAGSQALAGRSSRDRHLVRS
jgi:hypothetical protein